MIRNNKSSLAVESTTVSPLKENLADFLTLSRAIIGLTILSFSLIGKDTYAAVVIGDLLRFACIPSS